MRRARLVQHGIFQRQTAEAAGAWQWRQFVGCSHARRRRLRAQWRAFGPAAHRPDGRTCGCGRHDARWRGHRRLTHGRGDRGPRHGLTGTGLLQQLFDGNQLALMNPAQQRHLEVVPRLRGRADVVLGAREQVERAEQILAREAASEFEQTLAFTLAGNLGVARAGGVDRQHQQVAHDAGQLAADQPQVIAHFDGAAGQHERLHRIFLGHCLQRAEEQVAANQAEHRADVFRGDGVAGERNHLIELALRVAHAAVGIARNQLERLAGDGDAFGVGDLLELIGDRLGADHPELVDLRARQDGFRDLVEFRRRHHEDDVCGWLLHRLQQRVEGRG